MVKETIKLFIDGKTQAFERDLKKEPLNLEDFTNASKLEVAQKRYALKTSEADKMMPEDGADLINADIEFIVNYFRGQFTASQCKEGLSPRVMQTDFDRWYNQSTGLLAEIAGKSPKK